VSRDRSAKAPRDRLPPGFGALWVTVAVDLVGFGIVIPILPLYAERFGASPATSGLLLASFSLAQFAAAPAWGRLSDRIGRKPVLLVSLAGTAAGSLVTAVAPGLLVLFLGRVLDGASGGSVAVAQAAATDLAPPPQRARLLGLLGAAYGVGFVAGPALGGLASVGGPRLPFLLAGALAALNAVVAARRLAEPRNPVPRPAEAAPASEPGAPRTPLLAAAFLMTASFAVFETTFALLAARRLALGGPAISALFVLAGVVVAATNARWVAPCVRRLGDVGTLRLGLAVEAAGLAVLATADVVAALVTGVALLAAGHGLAAPAATTAVAARVAPHRRGRALGEQQAATSLARIAGPVLAGIVFGRAGPTQAFVLGAALALVAAVATRLLHEPFAVAGGHLNPARAGVTGGAPG
jgi:MFS family permease